ncbi:MAG TPA: cysteine desulfurase NifS [Desulfotomaculum sp.]|nr:cysteine desulfurase NifS [Desulfotomaculum sp.]
MSKIYFDHSATTPMHPEAAVELYRFLTNNFGNPASSHYFGRQARKSVEEAREKVAFAIGASGKEIIFTSGGTEADNMAIHGLAHTNRHRGNHIITSAVEHHAVLNTVKALTREGFTASILPPDKYGRIKVNDVAAVITGKTILITIMHANNEVGTIMPLTEIGRLAKERGIYFHTDAVQSFGKIPVRVDDLGVDLLSISGHKIYGPKGIGALYLRAKTRWEQTLFHGGAQEQLRRAGTENTPGIVALGKVAEIAVNELEQEADRLIKLRDKLIKGLTQKIKGVYLTGHPTERLPNHASFCFEFMEGESLLLKLDQGGIAASSGAACSAGSLEPSHVLTAMGIPPEIAHNSLRLSLGKDNTELEVEYFLKVLSSIIDELQINP